MSQKRSWVRIGGACWIEEALSDLDLFGSFPNHGSGIPSFIALSLEVKFWKVTVMSPLCEASAVSMPAGNGEGRWPGGDAATRRPLDTSCRWMKLGRTAMYVFSPASLWSSWSGNICGKAALIKPVLHSSDGENLALRGLLASVYDGGQDRLGPGSVRIATSG